MKFTNQRVPDDAWAVVRDYIAIELTAGTILAPLNDDKINSKHGPLGANERGANWVWCEITPDVIRRIASAGDAAMPAANVEEIETLKAQVRAGIEHAIDLRAVIIGLRDSVTNALDRIDGKKL